ncbi:uncharacterized protein TRIVIDRAFT_223842 [Trichoderma virens Gv29-8]|uniref:Cytochrome P450 n=1 Tax=Hypocrea virens (strain Gv29-8 / FGSC 10586) TaxID=413071 RepID=G9MYA3_HYPVG|nr:uncharacterized protein TRIVIDRAFT_223842 [Trichoderma virens Gv29-8]EHK20525.1 hypothetical protein TRIVIDRAFT_223842 [Trichoderma virens Gv29-8]
MTGNNTNGSGLHPFALYRLYAWTIRRIAERGQLLHVFVYGSLPTANHRVRLSRLSHECPLPESSLLEIFRLVEELTSIRNASKPMKVPDGNYEHHLKLGTWLSTPQTLLQSDTSIFPDPSTFIPDRFIETDKETGSRVARYGELEPWGSGSAVCRGRTFAEKEFMDIAACFITLWDMEKMPKAHGSSRV